MKIKFWKLAVNGMWPPKRVTINDRFYCMSKLGITPLEALLLRSALVLSRSPLWCLTNLVTTMACMVSLDFSGNDTFRMKPKCMYINGSLKRKLEILFENEIVLKSCFNSVIVFVVVNVCV